MSLPSKTCVHPITRSSPFNYSPILFSFLLFAIFQVPFQVPPVSTHTYWTRLPGMVPRNELGLWWRAHSKTGAVTFLLRAIIVFTPLSETEYINKCQDQCSYGCQVTMKFASHIAYKRLMSKIKPCPIKPSYFFVY